MMTDPARILLSLAALAALCLTGTANAEADDNAIRKCEAADGAITYTAERCPQGTTEKSALPVECCATRSDHRRLPAEPPPRHRKRHQSTRPPSQDDLKRQRCNAARKDYDTWWKATRKKSIADLRSRDERVRAACKDVRQ